jgi:hypothetical protein
MKIEEIVRTMDQAIREFPCENRMSHPGKERVFHPSGFEDHKIRTDPFSKSIQLYLAIPFKTPPGSSIFAGPIRISLPVPERG